MEPTGRRRWWATLAAASLVTSGLAMAPATAAPATPDGPSPDEKIESDVSAQMEADGRADVWVRFVERPDMTQFEGIADWNERGQAVVDALTAAAENSQGEVRDRLDDEGVDYEAFWATNSVRVAGADLELVTSLAAESEVEGIYATMVLAPPELEPAETEAAPNAIEWGVADINAPEVWDDLGVIGDGVVVASIDTGVQYDHPALVNQYRGNNGDGTFDHNYSWFDAAGTSPTEPADGNGHGTHVTGTMVGTDGGDNQIGVAPGAQWIAANGCCPSDAALVASGEWMLEPVDLEGENPDVSKRPHVINNSWGTTLPSNDPFMEDIIEAWAASGMFGVFANGNSGPACETSGAPGSRIIAYSVGNYTSSHVIAPSSGRGPGQDGEIKPNISAPGTAIRSSVPGNGYASYTGTSMASPHTAGAVALAWSGAPALVGDVASTRTFLDGTAIDTEDLQCGGTAEDNNVFGEGRLDALALLEASPVGDTGRLEGVVTDATDGDPIAGAQVHVVGPIERTVTTNSEGAYAALLSTGSYDLTVSAFGFSPHTQTVQIETDETTTVNVALDPAPSATLSGVVTDGSGFGFPLYARVVVDGTPLFTFTDPETGEYSLDLPEGTTYSLRFEVQYPGYTTPVEEVSADGDQTLDVAVPVDANTCSAPGYSFEIDGVTETFDGTEVPEGWSVEDYAGTDQVWRFDDPGDRGNLTGGEGGFAISDSDEWGIGGVQDTGLISPSVDMSSLSNPVVGFKQDWRSLGDNADVDVSLDGGETWTTARAQTASLRGPREDVVPLPTASGQADVQVRFHHYNADWDYWWQVDDVFLGNRGCVPDTDGGYVVGTVTGGDTDEGVVGGTVTNLDVPEETATTVATPADTDLADGFYWLFSSNPGTHPFEAAARDFESQVQDVTVTHADTVRADFVLGSGNLVIDPTEIEVTQQPDTVREHTLTVTNTGSGDAEVELAEMGGEYTPLDGADVADPVALDVPTSLEAGGEAISGADEAGERPTADPWVYLPDYPREAMDNRVVNLDGEWYTIGGTTGSAAFADVNKLDGPDGSWSAVAPLPLAASAVTAGAVAGQIVVAGGWVDAGVSTDTFIYDPAADAWTTGAEAPSGVSAAGTAVMDGKLYSVGGCTTSECTPMSDEVMAYDVDADSWEQLADYPQALAFPACGAVDGQIVCTGGNPGAGGVSASYTYDPGADAWTELPDAPVDSWASNAAAANGHLVVNGGVVGGAVTNATFAWNGEDQDWVEMPPSGTAVYRGGMACGIAKVGGSTGGFTPVVDAELLPGWDECGDDPVDVPWLTVDPMTFTVPAGDSVVVDVTTDSDELEEGVYTAAIRVRANTPQDIDAIPVTMRVVRDPLVVDRWEGGDRYGTAVRVSQEYEPGVDTVFVSTGLAYPDALSGSAAAGSSDGPMLLTRPDGLPQVTAGELQRLDPTQVIILGGTSAISDTVADQIGEAAGAPVERVKGDDRYGTAAALAARFDGGGRVFVATGLDYPDALAASARAGAVDSPVLLVRSNSIPRATREALDALDPERISVLGGDAAVDDRVVQALKDWAPTDRIAGKDRYVTAVKVSRESEEPGTVFLASGQNWPDALAGAARAAMDEKPLLLTRQQALPEIVIPELQRLDPDRVVVLGGEVVVSEEVVEQLHGLRDME